ncbi:MAG: hypothetical protein JW817_06455 [Clostridiales bacterium]|nr:hypothetical protein [Clostridiales bacterium]
MSNEPVGYVNLTGVLIIPFLILIFIGLCVLEFFLARKDRTINGLILPIVSFGIALIITLFTLINMIGGVFDAVITALLTGALFNIPTVILLVIFLIARASKKAAPGTKKSRK